MKTRFQRIFFFILLMGWCSAISQVANYEIGDVVDNFTVTDVEGNTWNLYDITSQGKYVYLDFFFDTCVPCQITQKIYNEFHDKYGCNEGELFVISINNGTDTNAEVVAFEEEFGGPYRHAPAVGIEGGCEAVDSNFGINGYPSYLLISPENVFLHRINENVGNITVETFEASFPVDFNPMPMPCSLGVEEHGIAFDVIVYPNPTKNDISLNLNRNIQKGQVAIYTALGQKVFTQTFSTSQIVLKPNLPVGLYILNLQTNIGSISKKIAIQ